LTIVCEFVHSRARRQVQFSIRRMRRSFLSPDVTKLYLALELFYFNCQGLNTYDDSALANQLSRVSFTCVYVLTTLHC